MTSASQPAGFYDLYDSVTKPWQKVLFNVSKALQSAELNATQSILDQRIKVLADSIYDDGSFITGGAISVVAGATTLTVDINAGVCYALGHFHTVPAGSVVITGAGIEVIGLLIATLIINPGDDPALLNPAVGAEGVGKPGASRLEFTYSYVLNNPNAVTIATFVDGQQVITNSTNNLLDQILALLALRTYEQSGSFIVERPTLTFSDLAVNGANPAQMRIELDNGIGYPDGVRVENINKKKFLSLPRPMTSLTRTSEGHEYNTGTSVYTLSNPPCLALTVLLATATSSTFALTRGITVNGADAIPSTWQPTVAIISIVQGMTTYRNGIDYTLAGNYIQWLAGAHTEVVAVGGTHTTGDIMKVTLTSTGLNGGAAVETDYTVLVTDTTTALIATGIANAINANTILSSASISAATDPGSTSHVIITYPVALTISFAEAVTGAATETMTLSAGADNGLQPAGGSSYNVVVQYTKDLIKGTRTSTLISAESHTTTGASTSTLTNGEVNQIISATSAGGSVSYILGVDFTINLQTGVITWINKPIATAVAWTYTYWVHTIEGDFVARDSFLDGAGNVLYYQAPAYNGPSGATGVDFFRDICFTAGGLKPVNASTYYVTYQYTIGRTDVLVWNSDSTFQILPGIPDINPIAVTVPPNILPICKLKLQPECFAAQISVEFYNNQTLLVTDLRHMYNTINTINYNLSQFQLAQVTAGSATAAGAAKRGLIADPFVTPNIADTNNALFAGTFDFLAGTFQLPRVGADASASCTFTGSGATLKKDVWLTNYTEVASIVQPYASSVVQIDEFGGINTAATVTLTPSSVTSVDDSFLNVQTQGQGQYSHVNVTFSTPYSSALSYLSAGGNFAAIQSDTSFAWNSAPGGYSVTTVKTVYNAGNPLTPADMMNTMLWQNLSPSTSIASLQGSGSSTVPPSVLDQIPVDPDWVSLTNQTGATSSGIVTQNQWATVIANAQIVTAQYAQQSVITVTGSQFIANLGAISATFNGFPIALTAVGPTVVDPDFAGCVKADSSGNFTATFTVPALTPTGTAVVNIVQTQPGNSGATLSYASATFTSGAYIRDINLYATFTQPQYSSDPTTLAAYYMCNIIGFQPNSSVLASVTGSFALTIAEIVVQAVSTATTINPTILATAITAGLQQMPSNLPPTSGQLTAIVDAVDYTSQDPNSIAAAIIAVAPGFAGNLSSNSVTDPLAQTFTMPASAEVSSIDLYFAAVPHAKPVAVALTTVDNGFPTKNYLAIKFLAASAITSTTGPTNFAFAKPVYLTAGTEYAFVVLSNDIYAELRIAVLGGTDPINGLITKNPATGTMLSSPNASTWQLVAGTNIKFNINTALFTTPSSILNLGSVPFGQTSSRFALYAPSFLPDTDCNVQYQYSYDNSLWYTFAPMVEFDMGNALTSVYLRLVLNGTTTTSPAVVNSPALHSFIWSATGAYLHNEIQLPSADSQYTDIWCDVEQPGSTTVAFNVSYDDGATWTSMTEVTGDATALSDMALSDTWYERHWHHDFGSAVNQNIRTECVLGSSINYITPRISNFRAIAS